MSCRIADELRTGIYRNMRPFEKWEECKRLRDTAWKLKAAGLKAQHPEWSDRKVQEAVRKVFLYAVT